MTGYYFDLKSSNISGKELKRLDDKRTRKHFDIFTLAEESHDSKYKSRVFFSC